MNSNRDGGNICIDAATANAYLTEQLSVETVNGVERHVESCPRCQTLLDGLSLPGGVRLDMSKLRPPSDPMPPVLWERLRTLGTQVQPSRSVGTEETLTPPKTPGFEILRELGRGGTGVVYLARDLALDRLVALKMILTGCHASRDQIARFRVESTLIARLHHPNLVQIFQVGELDGLPYFVMEYIDGGSLRDRLALGPFEPRAAAELVANVADAVQTFHAAGVVHRDLKPENILLGSDGRPLVADLGLASPAEDVQGATTRTGDLLGTPDYMAPEQAASRVDRAGPMVDIHAMGAILYEMLTGVPPFRGPSLAQTLARVISSEAIPPRRLRPDIPIDLETICLQCLRKDPARRYPGAGLFAEDLRRFLQGLPVQARPIGLVERAWRWCQRRRVEAVGAALLASLFGLLAIGGPIVAARQYQLAKELTEQTEALERSNAQLVASRNAAVETARIAEDKYDLIKSSVDHVLDVIDGGLSVSSDILPAREQIARTMVTLSEKLLQDHKTDTRGQLGLARAKHRLAEVTLSRGRPHEAIILYREALKTIDDLRWKSSSDHDLIDAECQFRTSLSYALKCTNAFEEAEAEARRAIERAESYRKSHPGRSYSGPRLINAHDMIGCLSMDRAARESQAGRHDLEKAALETAERHFREALAMVEDAWRGDPNDYTFSHRAHMQLRIINVLNAQNRDDDSEGLLVTMIRELEAQLVKSPQGITTRELLAIAHGSYATHLAEHRPEGAERHFRIAQSMFDAMTTEHPSNRTYRHWQFEGRQSFARFLKSQGRNEEAQDEEHIAQKLEQALKAP